MGTNNVVFLEVIEWFDESGKELVHRIPETGSGEIKWGAQMTVRESQAAVFFYNGKAYDAFGPGRHTLKTANIPLLTKILSLPWGMTSPLRAEVYFTNMKVFPNLTWGTRDPVAFRDRELGLIRLRAFGVFNLRILQPLLFINSLVGTQGVYTTEADRGVPEPGHRLPLQRLHGGEDRHDLRPPRAIRRTFRGTKKLLQNDFTQFGLGLADLYINSITPPPEVQKAIDDKSRLGVFDDLNKLLKMKAAMAMESAAQTQGEAGAGLGMGMGFMMPAMFAEAFRGGPAQTAPPEVITCPGLPASGPEGGEILPPVRPSAPDFPEMRGCGKNLPPSAKFCVQCGRPVEQKPQEKKCPHCGTANLPNSTFCNQCGQKM